MARLPSPRAGSNLPHGLTEEQVAAVDGGSWSSIHHFIEDGDDCSGLDLACSVNTTTLRHFRNVNFRGANLTGAQWTHAYFDNCDFTGANMTGILLGGTNFVDCVLDGAVGIASPEEEETLWQRVAERVLLKPDALDMGSWHNHCGTAHCIAGWAEYLTTGRATMDGEQPYELTQQVGSATLPRHAHMFFDTDTDSTLEVIRESYRGARLYLRIPPIRLAQRGLSAKWGRKFVLSIDQTMRTWDSAFVNTFQRDPTDDERAEARVYFGSLQHVTYEPIDDEDWRSDGDEPYDDGMRDV